MMITRYLMPITLIASLGIVAIMIVNAQMTLKDAQKMKLAFPDQKPMKTTDTAPSQPNAPVEMTDEEWKKKLTPEQYRIARKAGTEAPNGAVYEQFKKQGGGTYYCVGCDAELFTSSEKFDSHCGWPSFYDPSKAKNVKSLADPDGRRVEVKCNVCDAHLGHVFKGEGFNTPTDQRYCINGTVLKFVPTKGEGERGAVVEQTTEEEKEE